MWPNPQLPTDLLTFTEEILNEKLHFLCSAGTLGEEYPSLELFLVCVFPYSDDYENLL